MEQTEIMLHMKQQLVSQDDDGARLFFGKSAPTHVHSRDKTTGSKYPHK